MKPDMKQPHDAGGSLPRLVRSRKWSNFAELYDRHLPAHASLVMEIGVQDGGSMWALKARYPQATVVGIDVDPRCAEFAAPDCGVRVEIGTQSDYRWLQRLVYEYGSPDVVIDDGGHLAHQMIVSWEALFPLLRSGGMYVIEDIGCCWHPRWSILPGLALFYLTLRAASKFPMHVYNNLMFIQRSLELPSLVVTDCTPNTQRSDGDVKGTK